MVKDAESPLASLSFCAFAPCWADRLTEAPPPSSVTPGKCSRVHGALWLVMLTGTSPVSPEAGATLAEPICTETPPISQAELFLPLSPLPPPLSQAVRARAAARAVTVSGMARMMGVPVESVTVPQHHRARARSPVARPTGQDAGKLAVASPDGSLPPSALVYVSLP